VTGTVRTGEENIEIYCKRLRMVESDHPQPVFVFDLIWHSYLLDEKWMTYERCSA